MKTKPGSSTYRKRSVSPPHCWSPQGTSLGARYLSREGALHITLKKTTNREKQEQSIREALGESAVSIHCGAGMALDNAHSKYCTVPGREKSLWCRPVNKEKMENTDPKYISAANSEA